VRKKILFFGTPKFAIPSLATLLSDPELEVVGVVTQPDRMAGRGRNLQPSPVKLLAEAYNIPVFQPESVKRSRVLLEDRCKECSAAVVVAFGQLLPLWLLESFNHMLVNVHSSLLPRWRGAAPMQRALIEGDAVTGVSLMKVVLEMDAGPVYVTASVPISQSHTFGSLHDDLSELGASLLKSHLGAIIKGELLPEPQAVEGICYARKIEKAEGRIDWNQSAVRLKHLMHGLSPSPGAFCLLGSKRFKILRVKVWDPSQELPSELVVPGAVKTVVVDGESQYVVKCGEGALQLIEVQIEGKGACSALEFGRGHKDFGHTILSTQT
jgi:methionyl-tRNA formyltransferase